MGAGTGNGPDGGKEVKTGTVEITPMSEGSTCSFLMFSGLM